MAMPFDGLEAFYEALARALDEVGEDGRELFLTRLALMLANEMDDRGRAIAAISASLSAGKN